MLFFLVKQALQAEKRMDRFSNSRTDYWNQIIAELSDRENTLLEDYTFRYIELGQLLTHGFSITQLKGSKNYLKLAIWNADYDNKRFNKGIYNLGRLAITQHKIKLDSDELARLEKMLKSDLELTNWGGITLDGLFCQFVSGNKKLEWNSDQEINNNLISLIAFLRNKAFLEERQ